MSFSCADFTDATLNALAEFGWIDGEKIPADDPEGQWNLVCEALERHEANRLRMKNALQYACRTLEKL